MQQPLPRLPSVSKTSTGGGKTVSSAQTQLLPTTPSGNAVAAAGTIPAAASGGSSATTVGATRAAGTSPGDPQAPAEDVDLTQTYRDWYPRWWLLATFFCALALGLFQLWQAMPCQETGALAGTGFCQVTIAFTAWLTWRDPLHQILTLVGITIVYVLVWMVTFSVGMKPVQIKRSRDFLPGFLRAISEFRTISRLIYVYAFFAFLALVLMFFLQRVSTAAFALCAMILFVANSNVFYRLSQRERRQFLLGYGIAVVPLLAIMVILNRIQWTLLAGEVAVILTGLWALVWLMRNRATPTTTLVHTSPSQKLSKLNQQALEPAGVFRAWFRSLRRGNR